MQILRAYKLLSKRTKSVRVKTILYINNKIVLVSIKRYRRKNDLQSMCLRTLGNAYTYEQLNAKVLCPDCKEEFLRRKVNANKLRDEIRIILSKLVK